MRYLDESKQHIKGSAVPFLSNGIALISSSILSQVANMRVLNALTLALVAGHATAGCPYAERAERGAAPAAGCPYAKQAAKRDVVHAPARRQAIADKKGIFYSELNNLSSRRGAIDQSCTDTGK